MDYVERIEAKVGILFQIADQYLSGRIPSEEAKELINGEMVSIRPAQLEVMKEELGKRLIEAGSQAEREKLFELFRIYLPLPYNKLQAGHPIRNYFEESCAGRSLLLGLDKMEGGEATAEDWKDLYDSLSPFTTRIERQEKNFYPLLIPMGMRLQVEKAREMGAELSGLISENRELLESGKLVDFLFHQRSLSRIFMSYLGLEERVLYAKALTGLTDQDFAKLRISDDESGYFLAEPPEKFIPSESLAGERKAEPKRTEPKEIDPRQSIDELFRKYPKFREDFFILDRELEGLKGPLGRDLLKNSTVEMVAKSLRIDAVSLTDRINELLKSYF